MSFGGLTIAAYVQNTYQSKFLNNEMHNVGFELNIFDIGISYYMNANEAHFRAGNKLPLYFFPEWQKERDRIMLELDLKKYFNDIERESNENLLKEIGNVNLGGL